MKEKFSNILKNHYPILIIAVLVLVLFATNYVPGTHLIGWDNLHPEFNFSANIKRSIFAVWQEYQGLGLLGGMGHSADLLRQIFLFIISLILPNSSIRYFSTFLTLFIGSSGAYLLIKHVFERINGGDKKLIALASSTFYLLNISTIQTFYLPFEAFIAHYAALPWIMLASLLFLQRPSFKNAILTFFVFLLSTSQAYIPTLFISSVLAIGIVSLPLIFANFKKNLGSFIKLTGIIFLANSFWVLHFLFFTLTSANVNIDSKINQMATEVIYLQNKEFGDITNVSLLKGYLFSNVEPDIHGNFDYILIQWREFFNNPIVLALSYFIFGVIILGLIKTIRTKSAIGISFALLFLFAFTMLSTSAPPFSWVNDVLRENIPLFNQAFRFPYTKFLNIASLSFAVLLSFGILVLSNLIKKSGVKIFIPLVFILIITGISMPAFKGNFFYQKEALKIPNEYIQAFDFFKNQDKNTRIANFPQYTFWGWNFYNWGYSGSGFLWYGIEQPILDRTFDVWSSENENYYWEINHALYSKNPKLFEAVLNKYDINWLLVDKNIINPISPKSLFIEDTEKLIKEIPGVKKEKDFGNLEIYSFKQKNKSKNFVSSIPYLSSSNSYRWSNYDQAYQENGDYYSEKKPVNNLIYYPFRSIFTGKNQTEIDFKYKETKDNIDFYAPIPTRNEPVELKIPSLLTENNTLPVNIIAEKKGSIVEIGFQLKAPNIYIKTGKVQKKIWGNTIERNLFKESAENPLIINANGVSSFEIKNLKDNQKKVIGTTFLTTEEDNVVFINNIDEELDAAKIPGETIREWFIQDESKVTLPKIGNDSFLIIRIPKLNDSYSSLEINPAEKIRNKETKVVNCDNFRKDYFSYFIKESEQRKLVELSSKNASPCVSFYLPTLDHDQGYLVNIDNKNIKGRSLHFWVLNEDQKTPLVDTYFEKSKNETRSTIILPPMEKFGKSYSIHFDNISIGKSESGNLLGNISINPIPYYFINNLSISSVNQTPLELKQGNINVKHPNQSLYLVETDSGAIELSQSYSPYWKAYEVKSINKLTEVFPFVFGREIKNHVLVNNWANGWTMNNVKCQMSNVKCQIVIVYLPQYLEYLGLILTSGTFISLILALKRKNKSHHRVDF